MAYSGVYVFGDSLVDAGNALKLAQWYGDLTFSDLPDGAPTAAEGYFQGRFTDGYTFADLLSNKAIGTVTKPVFPYGFEDPWIGVRIAPLAPDPSGNNLNFAYGGAQVRQGDEVVQDLDSQTDTFRDALDGDAPPGALYIVTMGGNDVRNLAKVGSDPAPLANAMLALDKVAQQLIHELGQLIDDGARHFLITGCADVGLIPDYDVNNDNVLDAAEQARADAATLYSQYLDMLIRTEVVPALKAMGATVTYVPMMDYQAGATTVVGGLTAILPTLEALHNLAPGTLTTNLLEHRGLVFFDDIHPNAQVHALFGAFAQAQLTGSPWIETLPLSSDEFDFSMTGSIAVAGEVDQLLIAAVAGTTYRFDLLGMSSLGTAGSLGDPSLALLYGGVALAANADDGAGFDATLTFTAATSGNHALNLSAAGSLTGSYQLIGAVVGGAALMAGNTYVVNSPTTLVLEGAGGIGIDIVQASTSYALAERSEIEQLTTTNPRGKAAINLTGNDFAQTIIGNAGNNVLEGKGGADTLTGGAGNDVFVLSRTALDRPGNVDAITDYAKGDVVDITQILNVAAGVNVVSGGFVRVTTSGLVQVDVNGGGDQWVTLSTINGNGAVSVRYLSGGAIATTSVARVAALAATSASAASVMGMAAAASGLAVVEVGADSAAYPSAAPAQSPIVTSDLGIDADPAAQLAVIPRAGNGEGQERSDAASRLDLAGGDDAPLAATEPSAGADAMPHSEEVAAASEIVTVPPFVAQSVAIPPAAMLQAAGQEDAGPIADVQSIVADALDSGLGSIQPLLDTGAPTLLAQLAQVFDGEASFTAAAVVAGDMATFAHPDAIMSA